MRGNKVCSTIHLYHYFALCWQILWFLTLRLTLLNWTKYVKYADMTIQVFFLTETWQHTQPDQIVELLPTMLLLFTFKKVIQSCFYCHVALSWQLQWFCYYGSIMTFARVSSAVIAIRSNECYWGRQWPTWSPFVIRIGTLPCDISDLFQPHHHLY